MFEIKTLEFKNFLSYGNIPTTIDFDSFKSLAVSGRNGAGKSCLNASIFFALYGKAYRKASVEEMVNNINKKNLYVKITFENNGHTYTIERGVAPKFLKFFKDNEEIKEGVCKKELQRDIDKAIGCDYRIFNQLCFVDSEFYKPFMSVSSPEKRQIIDNIFGMTLITEMSEKSKEYRSRTQDKMLTFNNQISITKEKIRLNKQYSEDIIKNDMVNITAEIEKSKNEELENLKDLERYNEIRKIKVAELEKLNTEYLELSSSYDSLVKEKNGLMDDFNDVTEHMELVEAGTCKHCKSIITNKEKYLSEDHDKLIELEEKLEISAGLIKLAGDSKEKKELELVAVNNAISSVEISIANVTNANVTLGKMIEKDEQRLEELKTKEKGFDTTELERELITTEENYKKYFTMFNRFKKCESVLSDSGIRSYIIKKYLPMFNESLKKYLTRMEANFSFEFDSEFNQKIDERYRSSMNYGLLSTGQKARVNLAILFSLIEFAEKKSGCRLNILMLDEILESGLDKEGKEIVLDLIKHTIKKKIIFISHDAQTADFFDRTMKVEMVGNMSKIEYRH